MEKKSTDANPPTIVAESHGADSQMSVNLVPAPVVSGSLARERAIKNALKYNTFLNQVRREERRVSMNLQTYTLHYPVGHGKDNKMLQKNVATGRYRKVGKYPVATIHGQYQDWFVDYTPDELKYFPINTVLYGPVVKDPTKLSQTLVNEQEDSDSESYSSEDKSESDVESCSSNEIPIKVKRENGSDNDNDEDDDLSCDSCSSSESSASNELKNGNNYPTGKGSQLKQYNVCKICKGSTKANKKNTPEELIHCSECNSGVHPGCLQFTTEMVSKIKSYKWQCSDCKACVHCNKPHSEDRLLFCDICDRGYHTFCVGLRKIPTGKWVCKLCGPTCAECGTATPGEGTKVNWHHETIKILSPNGDTLRRHQILCLSCYKLRKMR